jgi:hypothetical protein
MDAGIIHALKAHYKRLYLRQVIRDFESGVEDPAKINVLQAIYLITEAWENITVETIKNCWRHTGILPDEHHARLFPDRQPFIHGLGDAQNQEGQPALPEVQGALREARDAIQNGLENDARFQELARDYLEEEDPTETEEVIEDQRIVELVKNSDTETMSETTNADCDESEHIISITTAKQHLNDLLKFIYAQPQQPVGFIKENDARNIRDLLSRTHKAAANMMKQKTIDRFFEPTKN